MKNYPSDVKVIVHVELINGEKRDYGISADSPSILGYLGRKGKEDGFVHLWNREESHMVNYESIRTMCATRYSPPELPEEKAPKSRANRRTRQDARQHEMSM